MVNVHVGTVVDSYLGPAIWELVYLGKTWARP